MHEFGAMATRGSRSASGGSDDDVAIVDNLQTEQQVSRLQAELAELRGAGGTEALLRAKDERIAELEEAAAQTFRSVQLQVQQQVQQATEDVQRRADEKLQATKEKASVTIRALEQLVPKQDATTAKQAEALSRANALLLTACTHSDVVVPLHEQACLVVCLTFGHGMSSYDIP